jgi:hypothetical protein
MATISSQLPALHQVQLQLRLSDAVEVAVPLDEAGNHQLAVDVDHLRPWPGQAFDIGRRSERNDPSAARRERLNLAGRLKRDDSAVQQHEFRRRLLRALGHHRRRAREGGYGHGEHAEDHRSNHANSL